MNRSINEIRKSSTFVLRKNPQGFSEAYSEVLSLSDSTLRHYATYDSAKDADLAAVAADWSAVGNDITVSIKKYAAEQ